jgi:hypothetical protein
VKVGLPAQRGRKLAGEFFEGLPESWQAFGGGVFVAGTHFDAEADAQVGDEVAVIDVAGAAGFLRVITDFGSLLVAVEGLDGDVDVEDPRQAERGGDAAEDLSGEPVESGGFLDTPHGKAHGILANGSAHA